MNSRRLLVPAILFALGCEGHQQPTEPGVKRAPSTPSDIIQDGAHGGNPDFFFLPPMVPLPRNNPDFELGKFNNALRPSLRIEICELNADHLKTGNLPSDLTTCGAIKKTFAPGSIQLVNLPLRQNGWWTAFGLPADGFYYALWDTRQSNLSTSKYYRIKVFVDGQTDPLGVADVDPMANLFQWKYSLTGEVIQLVDDVMLPIVFRVEKGALCQGGTCNSVTITNNSPTGSQSITVEGGAGSIAGARFPNGWLPAGGPQSVVVTIAEVSVAGSPTGGASETKCHLGLALQQFRGCFSYTTTPALQPIAEGGHQFAKAVTVAVCYELEGTGDPREKFAELYASGPNEPAHPLDEVSDAGLLGASSRNCNKAPPVIGSTSTNPLVQFASNTWRTVKHGFGEVFGVKTAYAVDIGLGGLTLDFSHIGPVITAHIDNFSQSSLLLGSEATPTNVIVQVIGSHEHAIQEEGGHPPAGIDSMPVTFSVGTGNGTLRSVFGEGAGSTAPVTVKTSTMIIDGEGATQIPGTAQVMWTPPSAPGTYTITANGPVNGPVTITATVVNEVWHVTESGGWNATWLRRGTSNVFDGTWVPAQGEGLTIAEMTYTRTGNSIHFQRTVSSEGALCTYNGTIASDGRSASGTETCPGNPTTYTWTATLELPSPIG